MTAVTSTFARFVPFIDVGPGVAAKVVVIARTKVSDAPLGEPFRVLTGEAAEKVRRSPGDACLVL